MGFMNWLVGEYPRDVWRIGPQDVYIHPEVTVDGKPYKPGTHDMKAIKKMLRSADQKRSSRFRRSLRGQNRGR